MLKILRSNDLNELLLQCHVCRYLRNFYVVLKVMSLLIELNLYYVLFTRYDNIFYSS